MLLSQIGRKYEYSAAPEMFLRLLWKFAVIAYSLH